MNHVGQCVVIPPNKIVVATDLSSASDSAVSIAGTMARTFKAKVTLLHVFQYATLDRYLFPVEWMVELIRTDVRRKLDDTKSTLCQSGIETEIVVLEGKNPAPHILRFVQPYQSPLLLVGTHAVGGMERFLLGSTAEEVLRLADCPVITAGPHVASARANESGIRRILFATDFSQTSLAAAPFMHLLQRASRAALRVLHVAQVRVPESDESRRFLAARQTLGENEAVEYITLHGNDISQAVVNEAERYSADLLVLGVRRAPQAAAHLAPKTAYQIIAAAPCAVLTVPSKSGGP
jgi:nucleotide-binding universal stress UspA family protein